MTHTLTVDGQKYTFTIDEQDYVHAPGVLPFPVQHGAAEARTVLRSVYHDWESNAAPSSPDS